MSDVIFEKLRFEAIHKKKSVTDVIKDRILMQPFEKEVEEAYDEFVMSEFKNFKDES